MLRNKKLTQKLNYSKNNKRILRKLKPYKGGEWEAKEVKSLKKTIAASLEIFQSNLCAYCGLPLKETSGGEIEHIARKGGISRPRYVEFTFLPYNLALACHYCNGPVKKGQKETVVHYDRNYKNCEFNIVHPYFDDPENHLTLATGCGGIFVKFLSPKGEETIKMFGLDDVQHNEARARIILHEYKKSQSNYESELERALEYRRSY